MGSPFDIALDFCAHGISTIPLRPNTKLPIWSWRKFRFENIELGRLTELFPADQPDLNVGVLCGAVSDRLAVIDCDSQQSFHQIMNGLGHPRTWIVSSHRGGHVYLRPPVAVRSQRAYGVEIKGEGAYVLSPGSLHPQGLRYEFLERSASVLEIDTLKPIPELAFEPAPVKPKDFPTTAWLLITGAEIGKFYASRSERECAACASLINRGFDYDAVLRFFVDYSHFNSKFAELYRADSKNAIRWLRLTYDNAARFVERNVSQEVLLVRELKKKALATAWPGRTGLSDRQTYLAHLKLAERCGKISYGASARQLAEISGLTRQTVARANDRLAGAELIKLDKPAVYDLANIWTLAPAGIGRLHTHLTTLSQLVSDRSGTFSVHDAFRFRRGRSVLVVWECLSRSNRPLFQRELVVLTGKHRNTVGAALRFMQAHGMIEREGDGWRSVSGFDFDAFSRKIGTFGKTEKQRISHVRQRMAYRLSLHAQERKQKHEAPTPRKQHLNYEQIPKP